MGKIHLFWASNHCAFSKAPHLGQCRFLQDLYWNSQLPQAVQALITPPRAGVRHSMIARAAWRCSSESEYSFRYWLIYLRKMPPTSFSFANIIVSVRLSSFNYGLYSLLYKPPIWGLMQQNGCIIPYIL